MIDDVMEVFLLFCEEVLAFEFPRLEGVAPRGNIGSVQFLLICGGLTSHSLPLPCLPPSPPPPPPHASLLPHLTSPASLPHLPPTPATPSLLPSHLPLLSRTSPPPSPPRACCCCISTNLFFTRLCSRARTRIADDKNRRPTKMTTPTSPQDKKRVTTSASA